DKEIGLYYLNNRYYDPEIMRFISLDDISYLEYDVLGGLNLWTYCNNNPIMYVDPDGKFPILAFILGILSLVGMGLTIGGVANDNSVLKSIGLSMVAISALIAGGVAVAAGMAGATYLGIIGGSTIMAGLGTSVFASAEYQHMITGNNWMLDSGMSKDWYNGLMITISALATIGTISYGVLTSIGKCMTPEQLLNSYENQPNRWKLLKELVEPGIGKHKGGISTYSNYINKWTGSKMGIHKIIRAGRYIHGPHFHPWIL
ncbi:MAG: RHS repeat-associated core domain-containing protein, partial [Acholeplasmatales bacterium]|nr:RHS repeat-associated core domain-containing protein [Acholeplasmatales bacterium]